VSGIRVVRAVPVLACVVLGGCAGGATSAASPDGQYRATSTWFQALRRDCPRPRPYGVVEVRSGIVFLPWDGDYIRVAVSGGGVSGSLPGVRVAGTYDGRTIQVRAEDGQCGLQYTLRRLGT
jgi:hypothetical protein